MALLIQNQASFVGELGNTNARMDERSARMDERFSHMEQEMAEIKAILIRHARILQALPEAIRKKIGFESRR